MATIALFSIALIVGALIGAVGIGGVLLAPALIAVCGMGPHQATATALCCVIPSGFASAVTQRRVVLQRGSLGRRLAVGLVAGSITGAWVNRYVPAALLDDMLAGVAVLSGGWLLVCSIRIDGQRSGRRTLGTIVGLAVGGVVGCGSALTGTTGPALLVPTLIAANIPTEVAVAVSQSSQALVGPAGALTYFSTVDLDVVVVVLLAIVVTIGYWVGTKQSQFLHGTRLQLLAAFVLLATGPLLLLRQFWS
jgi:uncharacterized membrane protein YfcA